MCSVELGTERCACGSANGEAHIEGLEIGLAAGRSGKIDTEPCID